jgi:hypothetical protein
MAYAPLLIMGQELKPIIKYINTPRNKPKRHKKYAITGINLLK